MIPSAFSPARFLRLLGCTVMALGLAVSSARAEDPKTFEVSSFTFTKPADWQWVPVTSSMRKAQLRVGEGDTAADIIFFHFGTQGGDVESNTKRWLAQFKGKAESEKIEAQEHNGTKVTLVSTEGTFSSGMPGGPTSPMENYALQGAILESPDGSVFVKMIGPTAVVKGAREKFLAFIVDATKSRK